MWLLEFLLFATTILIGWLLFGYNLLVWFVSLFRPRKEPQFPEEWPEISVVIPCFNESDGILSRLENIRNLDYPVEKLQVIFADGGSSDGTLEMLQEAIHEEYIQVIACPVGGKINQLNHVLPLTRGEIIFNSDADAALDTKALKYIAAEFTSDDDVWVVGAYTRPENVLEIERYYWDSQNKGRLIECDAKTSSIVIAQCYAFRRGLFSSFPEDVVADDIYVAFLANTLGYRTVYSRYALALELRGPTLFSEFLPHKFRKSNAFLRESLRFLYRLPEMNRFCKLMLVTRILQQLLLPWAIGAWVLFSGALLTLFRFDVVIFSAAVLALLLLSTSLVFSSIRLPEKPKKYSIFTVIIGFLTTILIILVTGISYPVYKQGSDYKRLPNKIKE